MTDQTDAARTAGIARPPLARIYGAEAALLVVAAAAILLIDVLMAVSVFLGGLIAVLPRAYFARQAFKHRGARSAPRVVAAFYRGEAGKLVLTAAMFAAVFAGVRPLNIPALFAAFAVWTLLDLITAWRLGLDARTG